MVSQTVVFTELELDQNFTTSEVMDYFKQQYFFFSCLKDFSVSKMTLWFMPLHSGGLLQNIYLINCEIVTEEKSSAYLECKLVYTESCSVCVCYSILSPFVLLTSDAAEYLVTYQVQWLRLYYIAH